MSVTENDGEFTLQIGDQLEAFQLEHDYTEFLPSAIAVVELTQDKLLRFGAFRSLSRADPADLSLGRQFQTSADDSGEDTAESLEELITGVTAFGNPAIDPLTAWNFDAGFEWYSNKDSILAVSGYYKSFQGGFTNVTENETFSINGQDVSFDVSGLQQVSDESSDLFGVEFTGSHQFSYLPGILSGLGVKVSYNYLAITMLIRTLNLRTAALVMFSKVLLMELLSKRMKVSLHLADCRGYLIIHYQRKFTIRWVNWIRPFVISSGLSTSSRSQATEHVCGSLMMLVSGRRVPLIS